LFFAVACVTVILRVPRAEIVFATSTPLTIVIPAVFAQFWHRAKFVFEVRDLWPEMPIATGHLKGKFWVFLARTLELWAYKMSDSIIALSPGMAETIRLEPFLTSPVITIPNSADFDCTTSKPELPFNYPESYLIYAGQIGFINGLDFLIDLARFLGDRDRSLAILVVGDGSERVQLEGRAKKLGLLNFKIFFTGKLSKPETFYLLQTAVGSICSFLPIPEMEKNSSNKFFDSLCLGVPVILNYGGWQAKLIASYSAGLQFCSGSDRYDLPVRFGKVVEALESPVTCDEMRENAARLAREKFDREDHFKDFHKVITWTGCGDLKSLNALMFRSYERYVT
jgi:glycosyltransferase involved in cell wall biosynthesis